MNEFVAYTSRWRTSIFVLGSLTFVSLGVWMSGLLAPPPVSSRASPEMVVFLGWITIAFFGMGTIVCAKIWWTNGEQVRIGQSGVRWLRWSDETIPWAEISDVTEWSYEGTRSIILHLRNPALFPGKGVVGFFGRANRVLTGGNIGISLAGTDRKYDDALAAIAHFRPVHP